MRGTGVAKLAVKVKVSFKTDAQTTREGSADGEDTEREDGDLEAAARTMRTAMPWHRTAIKASERPETKKKKKGTC